MEKEVTLLSFRKQTQTSFFFKKKNFLLLFKLGANRSEQYSDLVGAQLQHRQRRSDRPLARHRVLVPRASGEQARPWCVVDQRAESENVAAPPTRRGSRDFARRLPSLDEMCSRMGRRQQWWLAHTRL